MGRRLEMNVIFNQRDIRVYIYTLSAHFEQEVTYFQSRSGPYKWRFKTRKRLRTNNSGIFTFCHRQIQSGLLIILLFRMVSF